MKKYIPLLFIGVFLALIPTMAYQVIPRGLGASILQVYQGGTGASTFTAGECLVGNGAGAITTLACGAGGDVSSVGNCASGACYDGTSDGGNYLKLYDGDSNFTQIIAGSSTADLVFTFPTTDGNANEVLFTDGSGVLDWTTALTASSSILSVSNGLWITGQTYFGNASGTNITLTGGSYFNTIDASGLTTLTNASSTYISFNTAFGGLVGNVTGNADTASALAADPSDCSAGQVAIAIGANGNLTCVATSTNALTLSGLDKDDFFQNGTTSVDSITAISNLVTIGTIGTGVWEGTAVADGFIASANTWNNKWDLASTTIGVAYGGTGSTTLGGLLKGNGTSIISIGDNSANWNTAYSWGDHANKYIAYGTTSVDSLITLSNLTDIGTIAQLDFTNASGTNISATNFFGALTGNANSATALAANGGNCNAGEYPLGVDASGAVESCTDATTEINTEIGNVLNGTDAFTDFNGADIIDSDNYNADSIDDEHINWGTGAGQVSTDDVTEGSTNVYWTTNRFDTRLTATTTLPNLSTLNSLTRYWQFEFSTSTLTHKGDYLVEAATGTVYYIQPAMTITAMNCKVNTGTMGIQIGDGTASSSGELFNTTASSEALTTNNSFTANEGIYMDVKLSAIGTVATCYFVLTTD